MQLLQELYKLREAQKYWDHGTPESATFKNLFSKLVKPHGMSDTVEGELLRAVNKIYGDYNNNGFGNNWSGALNYIKEYSKQNINPEYDALKYYAPGKMVHGRDRTVEHTLDMLMDKIIHEVESAGDDLTPNHVDMVSLQDEDDYDREESWEVDDGPEHDYR